MTEHEIPKEDLDELQSYVTIGFSGHRLATLGYKVGRMSVQREQLAKTTQDLKQINKRIAAINEPAGPVLSAERIAVQRSAIEPA